MKRNITLSIDTELLKEAKEKGFNISDAAENGVIERLMKQMVSKTVYPEELAKEEPDKYWIDPKDGLCKERGEAQFFINENGVVTRATKEKYLLWLRYHAKDPKEDKFKMPKEGDGGLWLNEHEESGHSKKAN